MKVGLGILGHVISVVTFAAFLVASLALAVDRRTATGAATSTTSGGSAAFGDAWPFVLLMIATIAGGALLLAYGARQPAVGRGWPRELTAGVGATEATTSAPDEPEAAETGGRSTALRGHGIERDGTTSIEVVSAIAAVAALIVAILAFVEAASP